MKFIYLVSAFALVVTFGCNNQPAEEQAQIVEKETIREVQVQAPAPAPAQPVKVVVEEEKGTSIKIGPDGGSLKTKKVDINVGN